MEPSAPVSPPPRRADGCLWRGLRLGAALVVALVFLLFAAETLTHRHFSPDARYQQVVVAFAVLTAWLGVLPLLLVVKPRLARFALALWILTVVVLVVLAVVFPAPREPRGAAPSPSARTAPRRGGDGCRQGRAAQRAWSVPAAGGARYGRHVRAGHRPGGRLPPAARAAGGGG